MAKFLICTVAALTFAAAAHAQISALTPPGVNMEHLCRDAGERRRFYPERAQERNLEGAARIDCTLTETNALKTCEVIEETPPGFGFGDSALGMACLWVLSPESVANVPTDANGERHVRRTMRFTLPRSAPPQN